MSMDAQDMMNAASSSNCCGAPVMLGDMCSECHEHCTDDSEEGPTDEQQELSRAGAESADARYRQQMIDAGRGGLLP